MRGGGGKEERVRWNGISREEMGENGREKVEDGVSPDQWTGLYLHI